MCLYAQEVSLLEGWALIDSHIEEGEFIIITFIGKFYCWLDRVNFVHEIFLKSSVQMMNILSVYLFHMLMWLNKLA